MFEAYITNTALYPMMGIEVGTTVHFPTTTQEVQAALAKIGIDGKRYSEVFITSFDSDVLGLYDYLDEYENIDELNELGHALLEVRDKGGLETFEAALVLGKHTGSVKDLINLTQNLDLYRFYPDISDDEGLGHLYADELGTIDIPEHIQGYFDYEAYGRDMRINEGGVCCVFSCPHWAEREAAMSTFRVNKNVNYTVMSNHHLQDKRLSLKAKGLLSYMLSLPDDWDYSLKGLTVGCKDGLDSVRTAVLELEEHGYVRRQKVRNAKGQIIDYDYQVYESPVEDDPAVPGKEGGPSDPSASKSPKSRMKPRSSPFLDFPNLAEPNLEKATQQNTNKQNTKRQSTNLSGQTGKTADFDQMEAQVREEFRERLEIDTLAQRYDPDKLTSQHIEYIFDVLSNTTQPIKNIMAYLRTTILNAPTTMEHYYQAQGNWLTAQSRKK